MSDTAPVLRARTTTHPAAATPASEADAALDVMMRRARAVAAAGEAIPKSYRQNPGAVLLAAEWAHGRGLDLLTAIQGVTFISGKPVIDATLQRALAKRAGYRVVPTDTSPTSATVEVRDDGTGEIFGSATFTMDDARRQKLADKDNWKNLPEDMLVARATTRAMRRYAPEVMVGLVIADELGDTDPLDALAPAEPELVEHTAEVIDIQPNPAPAAVEEHDGHTVDVGEVLDLDGKITPATKGKVKAAIDHAKGAGTYASLATALQGEGVPLAAHTMTEAQGLRVLELAAES